MMGMYTKLVFNVDLPGVENWRDGNKRAADRGRGPYPQPQPFIDMDHRDIDALRCMVNQTDKEPDLRPDHELFKGNNRWGYMLTCDSYYHQGSSVVHLHLDKISGSWELTVNCNLKDYSNEIRMFLDWINPFCEKLGYGIEPLGYIQYEEDDGFVTLIWRTTEGLQFRLHKFEDGEVT